MRRRDLIKEAALFPAAMAANADVPEHLWQGFDFGSAPVRERLNQGPFDIGQDQGWQIILFTTPSEKPIRNPGLGLIGYTWEEGGPSLDARAGREGTVRAGARASRTSRVSSRRAALEMPGTAVPGKTPRMHRLPWRRHDRSN